MARISLSHFFTNQTLIDVFLFFVLHPQEEAYLAQIVSSTDRLLIQVQRTLKRLVDTGLILKAIRQGKTYYRADVKHIAYKDIKHLVLKAKVFSDSLKKDLEVLKTKVDYGFIYGSVAKGTNSSQSDIDLFFIGNLNYHDASSFIFHLSRELVQEVNLIIFSPQEILKAIENKNSFILNVLREPKIWLFGEDNEFEKIYRSRISY